MTNCGKSEVQKDGPAVRAWLYILCAMIFCMILVGGATRLTDSGLSITEWQLIVGIIPPLSDAAWQEAFDKYRQIPEYEIVNKGMSLAEFKVIYWWEWTHRFLGRIVGFVFLIPFLYFWLRRWLSRNIMPKLILMFVLGGLQGALGWYMVQSGLVERVDVSQYRLAAHLSAAVLIFGYIFWVATRIGQARNAARAAPQFLKMSAAGLVMAIFIQIGLGAFVAGLDAGQGYNTWPLIDDKLIPDGLGAMTPWYLNPFENALTAQFDHRMVAYGITVWAIAHASIAIARGPSGPVAITAALIAFSALAQVVLGIATLLAHVPIGLALAHQAMAVILFALALLHLSRLLPAPDPGPR